MLEKRTLTSILVSVAFLTSFAALGAEEGDEQAIRQAVLNYVDSLYEVKPELVERSVHSKLQKLGLWEGDEGVVEYWMTFDQLRDLAAEYNEDGSVTPEKKRRDVTVLDRLDKTAVARVDAEWGIDFFQLVKIEGTWKILHVIWQSYPKEDDS